MSCTIDQWKDRLSTLSSSERAELAEFLLHSLDPEAEAIESAWDAEASKRAEDMRSGRVTGRPVEEFLAELRKRYP